MRKKVFYLMLFRLFRKEYDFFWLGGVIWIKEVFFVGLGLVSGIFRKLSFCFFLFIILEIKKVVVFLKMKM